jgi:Ni/Co efflux regulator RcnB
MSKLLTTLIAIAFAAAASLPVAQAAEKGDPKGPPAAEKKKSEAKKAPAKPKGEAKKGEPKKAPAKPKGETKKGEPK